MCYQKHKADGMMDVVSRKCQVAGCLKRPWYSYDGVRSVLCAEHKTPGMVGYRPPQKDVSGAICVGAGVSGAGVARKRPYADISMHHHHNQNHHHHHDHPHNSGGTGEHGAHLEPGALDVGLAEMGMSEEEGLQEARALGLDGMGGEVLGHPRMGEPSLGGGGSLDAHGIGHGGLDPTGMGHGDLGHHSGLGHRGLETGGLDVGGGHAAHDLGLQPVLPAHVAHPGSLVGPSDKMFH